MDVKRNHKQNPILSDSDFIPDCEARVWDDGRIYLYGSYDIMGRNSYCSDEYHVYSSDDLMSWTDHGVSFRLADTDWAKDLGALYAPDCIYRYGIYYLYYCVPDGRCGVAVSDKPYGPFKDIGPIEGVHGIDPSVFIDDDGQAYLYWGQFDNVRVARLTDDMCHIIPETAVQPLSVAEHEFHEGSSMRKIGNKYYLVFTDTHRHGNRATSLGYAVSDNPMTGFKYSGIIIDNFGCDPGTWNDHGSIANFKGQWYVFYHRSTHGAEFSRHVCAEPITIRDDGSIPEVKMTSFCGESIPVKEEIPAHVACGLSGSVRITSTDKGLALTKIKPHDRAVYRYIDFDGENKIIITGKSDTKMRVELYVDGGYASSAVIDSGADEASAEMPKITGSHEIELRFYGDFTEGEFYRFSFE